MIKTTKKRYSDEDLEMFKKHIEGKLLELAVEKKHLQDQYDDLTENSADGYGDWFDDNTVNENKNILSQLQNRLNHQYRLLEQALVRIRLKTYGVCIITGELIDKQRLLAVPVTTKSILAKMQLAALTRHPVRNLVNNKTNSRPGKIISKVIRPASKITPPKEVDFFLDEEDELLPQEEGRQYIDPDSLADHLSDETYEED